MKIHDRKLHVLLTMEEFSKFMIIFSFQLELIRSFRMERFTVKIWENNKYKIYEMFYQKVFLRLNQIQTVESDS